MKAAADPVETALRREGFTTQRQDRGSDLADIFPGLGDELADWTITAPGGRRTDLQLAYFDRSHEPVRMDVGPVLHLEDAAGNQVCALAGRVEPRDYADTAALLGRWAPGELIGFARRLDPGLDGRDLADVALRLDRMSDEKFTAFGLTKQEIAALRERFAEWPRDARAVSRWRGGSRTISDSTAARHGREEQSRAPDLRASSQAARSGADRGQERTTRWPGSYRAAARERARDDELEIGR